MPSYEIFHFCSGQAIKEFPMILTASFSRPMPDFVHVLETPTFQPVLVAGEAKGSSSAPNVMAQMAATLHPTMLYMLLLRLTTAQVTGPPTQATNSHTIIDDNDFIYSIYYRNCTIDIYINYPCIQIADSSLWWSFGCSLIHHFDLDNITREDLLRLLATLDRIRKHTAVLCNWFDSFSDSDADHPPVLREVHDLVLGWISNVTKWKVGILVTSFR